jgi:deazaflavin-dependent oxidoreductase (nitroreductase family)
MLRAGVKFFGGLFLLVAAVGGVVLIGMRRKWPPVLDTARKIGRSTKPLVLKSAGTEGAFASVVRHVGRTTGRGYETPIVAVATDDGFVICLPYGLNTDWLKNVLAKGSATLVTGGETCEVDRPEVIPIDAARASFAPREQLLLRRFGVTDVLRVHRVAPDADDEQRDEVATRAQ